MIHTGSCSAKRVFLRLQSLSPRPTDTRLHGPWLCSVALVVFTIVLECVTLRGRRERGRGVVRERERERERERDREREMGRIFY